MNARKPEIMSPAGAWPQLHAAVEAGADAVYFGLRHFSARAKVGFALEELPAVLETLHRRGVAGYVTFNTLVFEHELAEAARTIAAIAEAGADAMIVQDAGVVRLARSIAPELTLHASTQMSISDVHGARLAERQGLSRITLARELSLREIAQIRAATAAELEIFVHGALCVAYSGQCFSSEAWGGRSANRGQCAQACRLPYRLLVDGTEHPTGDARYLLSPEDLSALSLLADIVQLGVAALKIEGRYKDADYVALVTAAYRRALDEAWAGQPVTLSALDELQLQQVYSRGLGPHFLRGTNHQAVVRGRAPRHRGVLMGKVAAIERARILIDAEESHSAAPLKPGDGVVFDAANWRSPEEPEEGGRLYSVETLPNGRLALQFANGALEFQRIRVGDWLWRSDDPSIRRAAQPWLEPPAPMRRQRLRVMAKARVGAKLETAWWLESQSGIRVEISSDQVMQAAQNRGLSAKTLREQFGRLGGTPYELVSVELDSPHSTFLPASELNRVRRTAVEALQALQARPRPLLVTAVTPAPPTPVEWETGPAELHLLVRSAAQLDAALGLNPASITLDYLDLYGLRPSLDRLKASSIAARVASPRMLKPGEEKLVDFLAGLDCALLVRSAGLLDALRNRPHGALTADFSLNAANSIAATAFFELGIDRLTPTHDLNAEQVAELARTAGPPRLEVVAYQHLPVFHTEHCVFARFLSQGTTHEDCGRPCERHLVALGDGAGRPHPVLADVGCRNTVFGAEAQQAAAHLDAWRAAGIRHYRLEFVHETPSQLEQVCRAFRRTLDGESDGAQLAAELARANGGLVTEGSLYVAANYRQLPVLD